MSHDLLPLLVTQIWQVTLLAVIVWMAVCLFAKNRPHLAHALWVLVLLKCLLPPIWSSPTSAFSWLTTQSIDASPTATTRNNYPEPEAPAGAIVVDALPERSNNVPAPLALRSRADRIATARHAPAVEWSWKAFILWGWVFGVGGGLMFALLRWMWFWRWLCKQQVVTQPCIDQLVKQLANRLGIKKNVCVRVLHSPLGPAVCGLWRPTVLLPAEILAKKTTDQLESLLAHELIHIRRGDLWWSFVQVLAKSLFWFHPLIWWTARRVTREAERSCDEETVASLGCSPAAYARGLLEILEQKHRLQVAPALPGVRPVDITSSRLERIMRLGNGSHRRTPVWVWIVMFVCGAVVLPGAALVFAEEESPVPQANLLPQPLVTTDNLHDDEGWKLETYDVSAHVKKARELGMNSDLALPVMLLCRRPGPDGESSTPLGRGIESVTEDGIVRLGDQNPTMKVVGNRLYVFDTPERQARVAKMVSLPSESAFNQITIETRFISGPPELISELNIDWTLAPVDENYVQREKHRGKQGLQARSRTVRNAPVLCAQLDAEQVEDVIFKSETVGYGMTIQAPKVTLFNGQQACVRDEAQRPFVVSVKPAEKSAEVQTNGLEPITRVLSEGIRLDMEVAADDKEVFINNKMTLSAIPKVEEFTFQMATAEGAKPVTVQIPEYVSTQIQAAHSVPDGQTVALSTVCRNPEDEQEALLVLITCSIIKPEDVQDANATVPTQAAVPATASQLASAAHAEPAQPVVADEPIHFVIRTGNAATAANPVEKRVTFPTDGVDYKIDLIGDVKCEMTDQQAIFRGEDLLVINPPGAGEEMRLMGKQGELTLDYKGNMIFQFTGRSKLIVNNTFELQAECIQFTKVGLKARGNVIFKDFEQENQRELRAEIITHKEDIVVLEGNAVLTLDKKSESPQTIRADRIEWNSETNEVRASSVNDKPLERLDHSRY